MMRLLAYMIAPVKLVDRVNCKVPKVKQIKY